MEKLVSRISQVVNDSTRATCFQEVVTKIGWWQGAEGGREALFEHESDYDRESPVETGFSLLQVEVEVKVLVTYTLTSFPVLAAAVQHHLPRCRTLPPLACTSLSQLQFQVFCCFFLIFDFL